MIYKVNYTEKMYGTLCGEREDHSMEFVISSSPPTYEALKNKLNWDKGCSNVTGVGCDNCPGLVVESWSFKESSEQELKKFGLNLENLIGL